MVGSSLPSHNLTPNSIKFLFSYGGRILPRHSDGKLRYHGGQTRLLSVDSSISFSELLVKMGEICGSSVSLRCQLPADDLDALISITSDEDLTNLIEIYDAAPSSSKIRAFLSAPKSIKKVSPPPSFGMYSGGVVPRGCPASGGWPFKRITSKPPAYPIIGRKVTAKIPHQLVYQYQLVHNGNHWQ
ncbi:hypothetical protein AAHA92_07808 [Salvia divinorum]|uniref:PB1 domain-containing protein n=1 Tax=Salvia divinorum TaxID=28513 RepID=A0ABD1IAV4_SALDI